MNIFTIHIHSSHSDLGKLLWKTLKMDADVIFFAVVICQELAWRYSIIIIELR